MRFDLALRPLVVFAFTWLITLAPPSSALDFARDESGRPRVVVIFSASYGGGHDASAEAIKAELEAKYPGVQVVILYAQKYHPLAGRIPAVANWGPRAFGWIYQKAPKAYDWIFERTMASAEGKTSAGDIFNPLFSENRIVADIERLNPVAIYSTYHIVTSKLIRARESGRLSPAIPIAWLDTDFVQRPFFWLHSLGVDLTLLAHPLLLKERLGFGVPTEKMVTAGLPINKFVFQSFSDEDRREFMLTAMTIPDRAGEASPEIWINGKAQSVSKAEVGLNPDVTTVTIASGRSGAGDYPVIIDGLIAQARKRNQPIQIIAVCGDNDKNYRAVTEAYLRRAARENMSDVTLVVSRLIDNGKLMRLVRSSKLFIGKSGSQSPFEAAIMGVPRVLIDIIGGQERWTANFFRKANLAEVVSADEQHLLAERAFAYLEDDVRMAARRAADQLVRDSYDLSPITQFYEKAVRLTVGRRDLSTDNAPARRGWITRVAHRCRDWLQ